MEIARYLKYGDSFEFEYCEPVESVDLDWTYAKRDFRERFTESMSKFESTGVAFCGTLTGCAMVTVIQPMPTWSVDVWLNTFCLSKALGTKNYLGVIDVDNLESELFKMNELWDSPRSLIEDIYIYSRQKAISEGGNEKVYCEGGTDWTLMGSESRFMPVMNLALTKRDYSILKATQYSNKDKEPNIFGGKGKSYAESFFKNGCIFTDEEIEDLGLVPPNFELRDDSLDHLTRAAFDWGYKTGYERRTKPMADSFGLEFYSPFLNDPDFINFCLSLPMEMKFCLGRGKHILKESISMSSEAKSYIVPQITPYIYRTIEPYLPPIINKFLQDKNNKIFKYLPYDKVQEHLHDNFKIWSLLNLAIWMEVHMLN